MTQTHSASTSALAGIVLAAGQGRRFGSNKLCHPLPDGTPIAVRSALNLRGAIDNTIAVVRAGDLELRRHLESAGIRCLVCERADEGMSATIACGVGATHHAAGWIVALGDMPFIETATIQHVGHALGAGALLAAPFFNGVRGHPVGFSPSFRRELLTLAGDKGARDLIAAHGRGLVRIETADRGVLADIDIPGDLEHWR